jgi:hypothetical protein
MSEAPPSRDPKLEIRSFRVVFQLERRLHRIQHWKLPLPYGLPLRGLAYGAFVLAVILLLGRLPIVGTAVDVLPPPVRFLLAPVGAGFFLARARVDGRPTHRFLLAWGRHSVSARWLSAFRAIPAPGTCVRFVEPIVFVPDSSAPAYRPARLVGPARVLLRYPARATQRGRHLLISQGPGGPMRRGKELAFAGRQEVRFR